MASQAVCRFLLLSVVCSGFNVSSMLINSFDNYFSIFGYLCINSEFVMNYTATLIDCAATCSLNKRCQAFTTNDGPCQLFVFDKCSKSVKNCSCSRRGQVFVKQQLGLEPGALCPSGYGDDLCGVKYKLDSGALTWQQSRQMCESERGLVIMADVVDAAEMTKVEEIYVNNGLSVPLLLGGFQTPGSEEPAGGWYWVTCNISLNASLWGVGEPNDDNLGGHGSENATASRRFIQSGLADFNELEEQPALCECVSPFD